MSSSFSDQGRKYASPVSRDGFFHSGDSFYVEIDNHRHGRTDSTALFHLLTYTEPASLLTKAGKVAKRRRLPHKDPPGHFYSAQLVHYGLKPMKTKAAAKKQLLASYMASGSLIVPQSIMKLEETLKKEYLHANQLAKNTYKKDKEYREMAEERKQKMRKTDRDAFLQQFIDADNRVHSSDFEEGEAGGNGTPQGQLQDAIATLPEKYLRTLLAQLVDEIPAVEQKVMMEISKLNLSGDNAKKSATTAKQTKRKGNPQKLNAQDLQGEFDIVAPYLSDEWPDYTERMTLEMCPSSTSSHLWMSFHFGIVSGIIRSSSLPTAICSECPFLWRGRESGEGQMSFAKSNTGNVTFLGNGKIKGRMRWMGDFEFFGKMVDRERVVWPKSVPGWKSQWRGFNERAYEIERMGRWGGGSRQADKNEEPSLSDTTAGQDSLKGDDSDIDMAY